MDGGQSQMFPLEEQQKKETLADSDERQSGRKKSDRFHSFGGCLQCCSLGGGEQIKPKDKEYCVLTFPDLRLFCYLPVV